CLSHRTRPPSLPRLRDQTPEVVAADGHVDPGLHTLVQLTRPRGCPGPARQRRMEPGDRGHEQHAVVQPPLGERDRARRSSAQQATNDRERTQDGVGLDRHLGSPESEQGRAATTDAKLDTTARSGDPYEPAGGAPDLTPVHRPQPARARLARFHDGLYRPDALLGFDGTALEPRLGRAPSPQIRHPSHRLSEPPRTWAVRTYPNTAIAEPFEPA